MPANETLRRDLQEMARLDRRTRAELAASGGLFDAGYEPRMAAVHERNAQRLRQVIESSAGQARTSSVLTAQKPPG